MTVELPWNFDMEAAPRDGTPILAYGRHTIDNPPGAAKGVKAGDHWWAIILWDVWRNHQFRPMWVFAKDGYSTWSYPIAWCALTPPNQPKN